MRPSVRLRKREVFIIAGRGCRRHVAPAWETRRKRIFIFYPAFGFFEVAMYLMLDNGKPTLNLSVKYMSDTSVKSTPSAAPEEIPVEFRNAFEPPFALTGFPWRGPKGELRRLPVTITAADLQKGEFAADHAWHTSGGEVRFRTDSGRVAVRAELYQIYEKNHMARNGTAGFACFTDVGSESERFQGSVGLSLDEAKKGAGFDGAGVLQHTFALSGGGGKLRTVSVYLPLYSGVRKLEIGLDAGAQLLPPLPRKVGKPICFYGSSITQGTGASHPGNNYTTLLCRALDAPQINMGFSGSARAEECVAKAIAGLELAAFVMDYDHNAKDPEQLQATHEKFFKIIRAAQPELPIVIVSGPRDIRMEVSIKRRDIVEQTWKNAVAAGDKNVYFVDGLHFYDQEGMPAIPRDYTTVDKVHPTDLGFHLMYRRILPVLKKALGIVDRAE